MTANTTPLLEVRQLVKRFGGLTATDHAQFSVHAGEIHALIGPNGAGKTTLIHQLSGALAPDSGDIVFAGERVNAMSMPARVQRGLVRSYQITSIFKRLSVLENLALAVQAHGEQRQLEVGLALACQPRMLLLDEPMAGMGPDESERMVELLLQLRRDTTILLVEHDMDAVFRLADRISALVFGKVIASGTPDEIRHHADVKRAYLGDEELA